MSASRFPPLSEQATSIIGLTSGQALWGTSAGIVGQESAFAWDTTAKKLSITGSVTKVSAAGSTWDSLTMPASTLTLTGGVTVTTATGVNLASLAVPTITSSSATTVALASTFYVAGPPTAGGSVTLTDKYSLWIDSGNARFDGNSGFGLGLGAITPFGVLTVGSGDGANLGGLNFDYSSGSANSRRWQVRTDNAAYGDFQISQSTTQTGTTFSSVLNITAAKHFTFWDGADFILGTGTGTRFGTASTQKIGFFSAAPVIQRTSGANLTNNVTAGGVNDTIADFSDLTVFANSAAAIRNDIYQLARQLKQVNDGLRTLGLFS